HHLPLDPTPQTLARYIAYTSRFIQSGPKYLTGARHFLGDIYPDFDKNRHSAYVQTAIRGTKKLRADPIKRKQPLRPHHLETFLQRALTSQSYDDLLFTTILSCALYACHRIGELVIANDKSLFDWRKIIKRASLRFDDSSRRVQYMLPYHKADPFYRGTLIVHLDHATASPVSLLQQYLKKRDIIHGARPALFIKEDGSCPTRAWFERLFFRVLDRGTFGAHSARTGGATYYASIGLSENVI
ncbi:hypothetical protein BC835DRAFT_1205868, partial [Cytidiella melzeri]